MSAPPDDLTPAQEHWTMGAGHAITAHYLSEASSNHPLGGRFSASIYLLIGNAIEVLLKAAFIHFGGTPEEARKLIWHNLQAGLRLARARGLKDDGPGLQWLVDQMDQPHREHAFRYMAEADFIVPEVQPALQQLIRQVGSLIYPGREWIGPAT